MGRQFYFYMTQIDQSRIHKIILDNIPEIILLKEETDEQSLEYIEIDKFLNGAVKDFSICLASRNNVNEIIYYPPIKMTIHPFRIRNILNQEQSPIIEYMLSKKYDKNNINYIRRGRLYYHVNYYRNNFTEKVEKQKEYIIFCQKLFKIFKQNLIYMKVNGEYIGEDALRCEKEGWQLTAV